MIRFDFRSSQNNGDLPEPHAHHMSFNPIPNVVRLEAIQLHGDQDAPQVL